MEYISTRAQQGTESIGFCDAILSGLAKDGGLYVPQVWPQFSKNELKAMQGLSYNEIALKVISPFVGDEISQSDLTRMIDEAYASFNHKAIAPITQLDENNWVLELFHGPTLAFKDVAMQLIARLMDYILADRGERATLVAATSGDTGGAAIEAFKGRDNIDVFVLFPHGRVSNVQQRQMTTSHDDNVHALAIEGNFDDCQSIVKAMFNHHEFRDGMKLCGANSINWGRIMAQTVYYFTSAIALGAPDRAISFTVPTGNFGDIFAGFIAKQMGLPIEQLVIASNENDILVRTLQTGTYKKDGVQPTTSPSMDIEISSNFERLLFDKCGRNSDEINSAMGSLAQAGEFTIAAPTLEGIKQDFAADKTDESACQATIKDVFTNNAMMIDPHTAVAVYVAKQHQKAQTPMITLSTAHPAKFPDAVKAASGIEPELPEALKPMMTKEERFNVLGNSAFAVETFIKENSRITK